VAILGMSELVEIET